MILNGKHIIIRKISETEFQSLAIIAINRSFWLDISMFTLLIDRFNNVLLELSNTKLQSRYIQLIHDIFLTEKVLIFISQNETYLNLYGLSLKNNFGPMVIYKRLLQSLLTKLDNSECLAINLNGFYNKLMKDRIYGFFTLDKSIITSEFTLNEKIEYNHFREHIKAFTYYSDNPEMEDIEDEIGLSKFKYHSFSKFDIEEDNLIITRTGNYENI